MADSGGPYSRPPSSAAAYAAQPPLHSPSPRPSVASRGSRSSLRRQAAIAAGSASASASLQHQQQIPQIPAEQSPPKFTQLFTIVTSTTHPSNKSTTHHPTVHYIFADDDPDILTEALAHHHRTAEAEEEEEEPDDATSSQPEEHPPAERAVVLDIVPSPDAPAGYEVVWASSLAPDWAVVSARVGRMDGSGGALRQGGGGGMLTLSIEGVSVEGSGPTPSSSRGKIGASEAEGEGRGSRGSGGKQQAPDQQPSEEYPGLMEEFDKRMDVLRRVVEAAEVRRRTMEAAAEGEDGGEDEEETQMPEDETQRPPDEEERASITDTGKGKEREHSVQDEEDEAGPTTG